MMKKIFVIIVILNFIFVGNSFAQKNVKQEIDQRLDSFLENFKKDGGVNSTISDYYESDNLKIYNDTGQKEDEKMISVSEYKKICKEFDGGIGFSLSPIKNIGEPVRIDKTTYWVQFSSTKTAFGFHNTDGRLKKRTDLFFAVEVDLSKPNSMKFVAITDSEKEIVAPEPAEEHTFFVDADLTPGYTFVQNSFSNYDISNYGGVGFAFALKGTFYIKDKIGFSAGLGFHNSTNNIDLDSISVDYIGVDKDEDEFQMLVSGNNISEYHSTLFLDIPLAVSYKTNFEKSKFNLYTNLGVNIAIPIDSYYDYNGVFTYKGYYQEHNVVLYDLDDYGYVSDYDVNDYKYLTVAPSIDIYASFGANIELSERLFLSAGPTIYWGLNDYFGSNSYDYIISSTFRDYNTLLNLSNITKNRFFGFNFGIKYQLWKGL